MRNILIILTVISLISLTSAFEINIPEINVSVPQVEAPEINIPNVSAPNVNVTVPEINVGEINPAINMSGYENDSRLNPSKKASFFKRFSCKFKSIFRRVDYNTCLNS